MNILFIKIASFFILPCINQFYPVIIVSAYSNNSTCWILNLNWIVVHDFIILFFSTFSNKEKGFLSCISGLLVLFVLPSSYPHYDDEEKVCNVKEEWQQKKFCCLFRIAQTHEEAKGESFVFVTCRKIHMASLNMLRKGDFRFVERDLVTSMNGRCHMPWGDEWKS